MSIYSCPVLCTSGHPLYILLAVTGSELKQLQTFLPDSLVQPKTSTYIRIHVHVPSLSLSLSLIILPGLSPWKQPSFASVSASDLSSSTTVDSSQWHHLSLIGVSEFALRASVNNMYNQCWFAHVMVATVYMYSIYTVCMCVL